MQPSGAGSEAEAKPPTTTVLIDQEVEILKIRLDDLGDKGVNEIELRKDQIDLPPVEGHGALGLRTLHGVDEYLLVFLGEKDKVDVPGNRVALEMFHDRPVGY